MKIVVCGLGKFGKNVTNHLAMENHNIVVIDNKPSIVDETVNQYDVMGYCGNGAAYETQVEAGVSDADLFIATTPSDETNIVCCLVAKKLGVKQTIARIRNPEYSIQAQIMSEELGINLAINPDLDTAKEIFRVLRFPSALTVESFANDRVDLLEIKVAKESLLNGVSLIDIRTKYQLKILICAVKREDEVIIPNGQFIIKEDDYVYLTADSLEIENAFKKLNIFQDKLKTSMIVGCGKVSYYLSSLLLKHGISVKIIDKDHEVCKNMTKKLPNALVLCGDGTNQKILLEEGMDKVDSVITLTGSDETNIIISTFANTLNCDKVITKVNNPNYDTILKHVGLESVVSPQDIFCSSTLRYVRDMESYSGSECKALYRLVDNRVEALEFVVSKATDYTSKPIKDLKIKKNFLLACIIRNDQVIIPSGKDTIEPQDSVVIITTKKIKDVSDIMG